MKTNRYLLLLLCTFLCLRSFAEPGDSLHIPKQEKLYLHTDKPYYLIGDTIWFKGYLVDMQTHRMQDAESRFIYVELIDRKNKVRYRKKIKRDDYGFSNYMAITPEFATGDYTLRAYTNYMRNWEDAYFFTKPIPIYSNTASIMSVNYHLEIDEDSQEYAIITFTQRNGQPFQQKKVQCMIRSKTYNNHFKTMRTNNEGEIKLKIPPQKDVSQYIDLTLLDGNLKLNKKIYLPDKYDYSVGFYPEGGHLLAGVEQTIAFKAETTTGVSTFIEGYVLNQWKDTLAYFQSEHEGIGSFVLNVEKEDSLYAVFTDGNKEKKLALPMAVTDKVALAVTQTDSTLNYRLMYPADMSLQEELQLLVHVRGNVLYHDLLKKDNLTGTFSKDLFPEGIVHLTVFNEKNEAITERLAFIRKDETFLQVPHIGKASERRSQIKIGMKLLDKDFTPLQGSFSLSITDDYAGVPNMEENHIQSALLLTSDLKGEVRTAGYYLSQKDEIHNRHLDQLMLTQGWSRFSTNVLLENVQDSIVWKPETEQMITGKVKDWLGRKNTLRKKKIVAVIPKYNKTHLVDVDGNGVFRLTHDYPDYTGFAMSLTKGKQWKSLVLNEIVYPNVSLNWPSDMKNQYKKGNEYLNDITEGYIFIDGEKVYQMPEVEVQGVSPYAEYSYLSINTEFIEQKKAENALELLNQMPEICIVQQKKREMYINAIGHEKMRLVPTGKIRIGLNNHSLININPRELRAGKFLKPILHNELAKINECVPIRIFVDGNLIKDQTNLMQLKAEDIQFIDMTERRMQDLSINIDWEDVWDLDQNEYIDFSTQSIRITTFPDKRGRFVENDSKILKAVPLGYAANATFYAPQYPTPESRDRSTPDNRTTIHWEPNITLNENGEAAISFYTADRPSTYTVVIEGVTTDGRVCRYVKKIVSQLVQITEQINAELPKSELAKIQITE